jgi:hypothetical protein
MQQQSLESDGGGTRFIIKEQQTPNANRITAKIQRKK